MYVYIKPCMKNKTFETAQIMCGRIIEVKKHNLLSNYIQKTKTSSFGYWAWSSSAVAELTDKQVEENKHLIYEEN